MGRSDKNDKKSFRFFLNHSKAIVANSYLILYPKPEVAAVIAKDPKMVTTLFEALPYCHQSEQWLQAQTQQEQD